MKTLKRKIEEFWEWFQAEHFRLEREIDAGDKEFAANEIGSRLNNAGISILCEAGKNGNGYAVTLSPCSDKTAQLLCRFWRELAPEISRWKFQPFRKPQVGVIPELVRALGSNFALDSLRFYLTVKEKEEKLDVWVVSHLFTERDLDDDLALCRLLCYILLGEAATEMYIGKVTTAGTPPEQADYPELDAGQFVTVVESAPLVRPWSVAEDPTSLCFGYGKEKEDRDQLRQDILAGISRHPQLISYPFAVSDELRLKGGEYCYLYYAVDAKNPQNNAAKLSENLYQVENLLREYQIGYVIGHATGRDFNYIDLMILDEPLFRTLFHDTEHIFHIPVSVGYFSLGSRNVQ